MIPNDPFYASQWHFSLIGDIEAIWDEYSGAGVSVLIYDDGIQYDHPDLDDNYDGSGHFSTQFQTFDPYPEDLSVDGHGTSVSGLIAAEANNGIGGVGVAHGAKITGIDLFNDLSTQPLSVEHDAFEYGKNFDIMSNSWGYTPDFSPYLDLGDPISETAQLLNAMEVAVNEGRGGLGSVITLAGGNETMNAGGYGGVGSQLTIAVAATNALGMIEDYANWGPSLLLSAPGATDTTDITGSGGFSIGDTTDQFGGTSASTPIVSGVVALMLEAAPGLGWRDVKTILALSAAQTGSDYGAASAGNEIGAWRSNGADTWNGGGLSWHMSYGFGMVDAFAAVRMAEVWGVMSGAPQTLANQVQTYAESVDLTQPIIDLGSATMTLDMGSVFDLEHLHVTVNMIHDEIHELDVDLIAPDGTVVPLLLSNPNRGRQLQLSPSITTFEHDLGVTSLLGMNAAGTWTLEVRDPIAGGDGTLIDFTIDFFGRGASANEIYTFTTDFEALQTVDGDRDVISDTNGGTDWLNYAAFSGPVKVKLNVGEVHFDGKVQSVIATGTDIENAVTGDGRDSLHGNALNNHLMGMRGNDDLRGNSGMDMLDGGAGSDTMRGGADRDTLDGGAGGDWLLGGKARDRIAGDDGDDTLSGDMGKDMLMGGKGDDDIKGGHGRDRLLGGKGNDTLDGGSDADELTGNLGVDTFVFAVGYGRDDILDFVTGQDVLQLDTALWGGGLTVAQVLALADDSGPDVVFDFTSGDRLTLIGVETAGDLSGDLILV